MQTWCAFFVDFIFSFHSRQGKGNLTQVVPFPLIVNMIYIFDMFNSAACLLTPTVKRREETSKGHDGSTLIILTLLCLLQGKIQTFPNQLKVNVTMFFLPLYQKNKNLLQGRNLQLPEIACSKYFLAIYGHYVVCIDFIHTKNFKF